MPPPRTAFARRVLALLRRIPSGRVVTYGDLAAMAGQPGAARAVGTLMRRATEPGLPCHRVIAAGGRIGAFGGDPERKRRLLAAEGVRLTRHRVADFERRRWPGPS
jgi:O-6-methylguanine DNA methyltransferase